MKKDISASFKRSTVLPWIEMRIASQSSACYNAHSHDEFSFGIIEQGRALYRNRNRTHQIGAGDIVTINPADVLTKPTSFQEVNRRMQTRAGFEVVNRKRWTNESGVATVSQFLRNRGC